MYGYTAAHFSSQKKSLAQWAELVKKSQAEVQPKNYYWQCRLFYQLFTLHNACSRSNGSPDSSVPLECMYGTLCNYVQCAHGGSSLSIGSEKNGKRIPKKRGKTPGAFPLSRRDLSVICTCIVRPTFGLPSFPLLLSGKRDQYFNSVLGGTLFCRYGIFSGFQCSIHFNLAGRQLYIVETSGFWPRSAPMHCSHPSVAH